MPIGGMQNRLRRIPRPSRRGNFQATDNVPCLSRNRRSTPTVSTALAATAAGVGPWPA